MHRRMKVSSCGSKMPCTYLLAYVSTALGTNDKPQPTKDEVLLIKHYCNEVVRKN